jgi:hypothetical protein
MRSGLATHFLTTVMVVSAGAAALSLAPPARAATIAYWRFEPGNLTADSSGNANTLANSGVTSSGDIATGTPIEAPGAGSAVFDNASFMNTVATLNLATYTQITIEWFQKSSSTQTDVLMAHKNAGTFFDLTPGLMATINDGGPHQRTGFFEAQANGTQLNYVRTPGAFANNVWEHYAVTLDTTQVGAANRLDMFKNGVNIGVYDLSSTNALIPLTNQTFWLGARSDGVIGGGGTAFFTGLLDEVRISDEILSPVDFIPEPAAGALLLVIAVGMLRRGRRS